MHGVSKKQCGQCGASMGPHESPWPIWGVPSMVWLRNAFSVHVMIRLPTFDQSIRLRPIGLRSSTAPEPNILPTQRVTDSGQRVGFPPFIMMMELTPSTHSPTHALTHARCKLRAGSMPDLKLHAGSMPDLKLRARSMPYLKQFSAPRSWSSEAAWIIRSGLVLLGPSKFPL